MKKIYVMIGNYGSGKSELALNFAMQAAARGDRTELTLKEFELLTYLMEHINRVVTRDELLDHIWGYDYDGETRTLDMHIKTLRQKLHDAGAQIKTVRGVGYRFLKEKEAGK